MLNRVVLCHSRALWVANRWYSRLGSRHTLRHDLVLNGVPDVHHDFDAANQVVGWGYDAAGNVLSDTSRSYPDDVLNRLTGLSEGSRQHADAYNGDGLVISQTVNGVATLFTQDLAASQSQVLQTQASGATAGLPLRDGPSRRRERRRAHLVRHGRPGQRALSAR